MTPALLARHDLKELAQTTEERRRSVVAQLEAQSRASLGQYFTPWAVADLMASMLGVWKGALHMLDAGAGHGALSAAWVARLCERRSPPSSVRITAFELDGQLLPALKETLAQGAELCARRGIELVWSAHNEDFVAAAVRSVQLNWFEGPLPIPNVAVLNPPYRKIGATSETRRLLRSVGLDATNLYSAFVALTIRILAPGGEFVAITPRSFCNGPYFRPFRRQLLGVTSLRRIHVFERRDTTFSEDAVLQENVIVHAQKSRVQKDVIVSQSRGPDATSCSSRRTPFPEVVHPDDPDSFIHIAPEQNGTDVTARMLKAVHTLESLGLSVSTGRVVDFRSRDLLRQLPGEETVPLIYPLHFDDGFVRWPKENARKANALATTNGAADLLVPNGTYVLVKRFSAKEEARRIVAAVCAPERFAASSPIAFENHLNYFHAAGNGLPPALARGLAAFLNTSLVDACFRQFSGHTQVNATDLRRLRYPSRTILEKIGIALGDSFLPQGPLDSIVDRFLAPVGS